MLASTVQFSTYDQTPATRPRRPRSAPRGDRWYEMQTGPEPRSQHPTGLPPPDGPLPQDPTACLRPGPAPELRSTHPLGGCRTGSPRREPAELVSVPPSSTTPGSCDPPEMVDRPVLGAALDHHTDVAASAP